MLWHNNARVNSHQRWNQMRFRVCFHLWCELTSTMNVTEWQVSWNSCQRAVRGGREGRQQWLHEDGRDKFGDKFMSNFADRIHKRRDLVYILRAGHKPRTITYTATEQQTGFVAWINACHPHLSSASALQRRSLYLSGHRLFRYTDTSHKFPIACHCSRHKPEQWNNFTMARVHPLRVAGMNKPSASEYTLTLRRH